jgi:hypothetical protein
MLFSDERKHSLTVPTRDGKGNAVTVGWLVDYLCEEVMKDTRREMFLLDGHVYVLSLLSFHRFSTVLKHQGTAFHRSESACQGSLGMYKLSLAAVPNPASNHVSYSLSSFAHCYNYH